MTIRHRGRLAQAAGDPGVTISDFKFAPGTITISVGDTITWSNNGPSPHTATANDHSFNTGTLNKGQSASHTFNTAGTFAYICTIHPFMHGTIVVRASSSSGSGGSGSSSGSGGSGSSSGSGGSGSSSGSGGSGSSSGSGSSASSGSSGTDTTSATRDVATPDVPSLPTTGLNLAAILLAAGGLLGVGIVLRRRSQREATSVQCHSSRLPKQG